MMWTDAALWTSLTLALLTALSGLAWVAAARRYRLADAGGERGGRTSDPILQSAPLQPLLAAVAVGAALVFLVRWLAVNAITRPIAAHVDGLALVAAVLAAAVLLATRRGRLTGLAAFALPLLTLVLLWGVCAALWTYRPFTTLADHPATGLLHIVALYIGGIAGLVAASSAAMYLVLQRRLKHKRHLGGMGRLASLEALERVTFGASAVALAVLTLGVVGGLAEAVDQPRRVGLAMLWNLKVAAGLTAWLLYGLAVAAGWSGRWRGVAAAWLAIAAAAVLAVGYAVAASGQTTEAHRQTRANPAAPEAEYAVNGRGPTLASSPCPDLQTRPRWPGYIAGEEVDAVTHDPEVVCEC